VNPDDPRALRTRARLRTSILELALLKELSSITMAEVAGHAEVNRATVYQHFPDIDTLATEAMQDVVVQVAHAAALCPHDAPRDEVPAPLGDLFACVAAHAVLFRRLLGTQGSARFAARMREAVAAELAASFAEGRRPPGAEDVPVDVHAAYLAGAVTGVVTHWITGERPVPAERVALDFWRLFRI
jgi:AcrR family transcriptional regulator